MSISVIISAFSKTRYLKLPPTLPSEKIDIPGRPAITITELSGTEIDKYLYPPPKQQIEQWRDRLARKYRSQLNELLSWDEGSDFETSADFLPRESVAFSHTAASIDILGEQDAGRKLAAQSEPTLDEFARFSKIATGKGYLCRFPQILLGVQNWLPFRRDMIIEEPNWEGHVTRFGSLFSLRHEIETVRSFIRSAVPNSALPIEAGAFVEPPMRNVLTDAWSNSIQMLRATEAAWTRRLPMIWSD
jgi:hypothetical protein